MKKGKKLHCGIEKLQKLAKQQFYQTIKLFPRADCEGMWQVPIFAIISTYATCQSEHYQDIDNIMCTM